MSFQPTDIHHVEIFPPIAVARLGDSGPDTYYLGPEVPDVEPLPSSDKFRDGNGRIRRQAARFHAYAFKADGTPLGELKKADGYNLTWTVSVANKKAAWVKFRGKVNEETYKLRNPNVQPYKPGPVSVYEYTNKRDKLIIRAKDVITSDDNVTKNLAGKFNGGLGGSEKSVTLGHLKVDHKGSLIFIAGDGDSQCVAGENNPRYPDLTEYFDSEYWYDSTCDGNVRLEVNHEEFSATLRAIHKATITTAPPKFTPGLSCIASLYDIMEDVYERPKRAALGKAYHCGPVEYYAHIMPIFHNLSLLSWTNEKAYQGHGPYKLGHFKDDLLIDASHANLPIRKAIFDRVRAPIRPSDPQDIYIRNGQAFEYYMPRLSGNAGDIPENMDDTRNNRDRWCSLTELQYDRLSKWAAGRFKPGVKPPIVPKETYEDYSVDEQPTILSRAALQWTTGAPLYPGIEAYWIVESSEIYEPGYIFRFNESVKPGDLTKGLSLPWQADFFMWPHVRPDNIITKKSFDERRKELNDDKLLPYYLTARELWHRDFKTHESDEKVGATEMVKNWTQLGFISKVAVPNSPMDIYVETERLKIPKPIIEDAVPIDPVETEGVQELKPEAVPKGPIENVEIERLQI